jgi:hypothetical protein
MSLVERLLFCFVCRGLSGQHRCHAIQWLYAGLKAEMNAMTAEEGRSGLCVILLHFTSKFLPGDRRPAILVGGGHRYEQKAVADLTHNKLWVNDVKSASPTSRGVPRISNILQ